MDWALVSWKNYALTPQESNQRPRDDPLYLLSHCCHMHFSRFWFQLRYLCLRSNLIAYHENNFNHLQRPKISQRAEKCLQPLLTCWVNEASCVNYFERSESVEKHYIATVYRLQWVWAFIWLIENSLGRLRERKNKMLYEQKVTAAKTYRTS